MKIAFDFQFIYRNIDSFVWGFIKTLEISLLAILLALVAGFIIALLRMSKQPWLSLPAGGIIEFIRNTPLLIQIYVIFFGLFTVGIDFSAFMCGIIALGLHYTTYMAEVYRAGVESVSRTQREAAAALGFNRMQTMRLVILPQAVANIIPPAFNEFIAMIQGSSLVSAIGVMELTQTAKMFSERTAATYESFFLISALYLVLNSILTTGSRFLENRLTAYR